jgi:predicted DNA-binding transcriptional regulator AlpA
MDQKTQLLTPQQAAEFLTMKQSTLAVWRCNQRYMLPFVKIGSAVRYDLRDLEAFVESRKVRG